MQKVDTAELRRLHQVVVAKGVFLREEVAFSEACKVYLPALINELEAARKAVRRLTQANGDIRKERDRAVKEAQRQDGVAKGLRRELREESNRWVSVIRGIDLESLCDFHDEHGAQEYLKAWLHTRDRRMKLIGAAEELERLEDSTHELREMYLTEEFYGLRAFSHERLGKSMKQRAAQLRQEAEEK